MTELRRIMHIEDDPDIREITRMSLELIGDFDVIQFEGGDIALENLPDETPDMILLDVTMPVLDGVATLARLREIERYRNVAVLYVTANTDRSYRERLKDHGAVDVITKPFEPMKLPDQLRKIWAALD